MEISKTKKTQIILCKADLIEILNEHLRGVGSPIYVPNEGYTTIYAESFDPKTVINPNLRIKWEETE